ncbi:MAG TPA: peptidase S10 [Bryobacteraceae bacterium]
MHKNTLFAITIFITVTGLLNAQQRNRPGANPEPTAAAPAATPRPVGPPPEEKTSITHHKGRFGGQDINYTATAATYHVKDNDGKVKATFFAVSYTKDGDDVAHRPISFVYNGGPGSGSNFTHMGLGPKEPILSDDGHGSPAPYLTEDNPSSFLDATDMVFIDAVSTGYTRATPGENPSEFYGVAQDATIFADFIYTYITRHERWASPKFLIGESYGTTRSAMLSNILDQRHQIYLNGVALLSSVGFGSWGADDRTKYFLPTLITSAWYHKLLPPDLQKLSIEDVAKQARQFAHGEYAQALEKGDQISPADYQKVVKDLARFTGLSTSYIEQTNLRVSPQRWFKELLRGKRETTGRLDSRFTGYDVDAAGERVEYDSSEASYEGAYVAAFQDHVRRELKWNTDMYYQVTANVRPWDQGTPGMPAEALRSAMTRQTHMKLLVLCGYYDLATPYNGIEQTVSHMNLEPSVRKNASFTYYEAGHMMYIDKKAREKLHQDVTQWINSSYQH